MNLTESLKIAIKCIKANWLRSVLTMLGIIIGITSVIMIVGAGTGVRDYIHVVDLAKGHVKALKKIEQKAGLCVYNLGTGHGYSVLDIVKNFEEANDIKIPYTIKPRRPGDIATCYCDPSKAKRELGWEAEFGIKEMCADSWRWQKNNPNGYES